MFNLFKNLFFNLSFLFQKRTGLALGTQVFLIVMSMPSHAFLSEILEAKKKIESSLIQLRIPYEHFGGNRRFCKN